MSKDRLIRGTALWVMDRAEADLVALSSDATLIREGDWAALCAALGSETAVMTALGVTEMQDAGTA